jgi:NitT/TauT family transport system permease protein
MSPRMQGTLLPWVVVAAMFVVWEIGVRAAGLPPFVLPAPTAVFAAFAEFSGPIMGHAMHTLGTTLAGFALSVVGGVALGVAVGSSAVAYRALFPVLIGFNSIPKVAIVPVLIIWFGIGAVPAIITACLISFFPITVNVATGIATVEPELRDVLRSLGATKLDILRKVGLPRAAPYFFASLKVAITLAFVGSIISETVGSNEGVGYLMIQASSRFQIPLVFAALLVVAAMGVAMYLVFAVIERRMTFWATRGIDAAYATGG